MTVGELISLLQKLSPGAPILVEGHENFGIEGGYTSPTGYDLRSEHALSIAMLKDVDLSEDTGG